jgi:hypothetical protein
MEALTYNQETKKLGKYMLADRQFVTQAGNLIAEEGKTESRALSGDRRKKKQVVETTCESHEKTSGGNYSKPGKLPPGNLFSPGGNILT